MKIRTLLSWGIPTVALGGAGLVFFYWKNDVDLGWWISSAILAALSLYAFLWFFDDFPAPWPPTPLLDGGVARHHSRGIGRLLRNFENLANGRQHDVETLHRQIQEVCAERLEARGVTLATAISQGTISVPLAHYLKAPRPPAPRRNQLRRFLKEIDAV